MTLKAAKENRRSVVFNLREVSRILSLFKDDCLEDSHHKMDSKHPLITARAKLRKSAVNTNIRAILNLDEATFALSHYSAPPKIKLMQEET
jgi:hypothetical protein